MENISSQDKVTVLLNLLEIQTADLRKKEDVEQALFQWTTSLLLAVFGAIIALSDSTKGVQASFTIKILATIIVVAPTVLSVNWIFRRSRISIQNAIAIENIQELLGLFDKVLYGSGSPYPVEWQGRYVKSRKNRKTPFYYATVIFIMTLCVVLEIWLFL